MASSNDLIHIAPESVPADFFEVRVATLPIPVRVQYSAIRDLRAGFDGNGESMGLLLGSSSPQARSIQHCELLALSPSTLGDAKALQGALHQFIRARLQTPLDDAPELLGCFRTQTNGWPRMRESDLEIAKRSFPGLDPLFLLIRTTQHRPWLTTLYSLDAATTNVPSQPAVEFPFDEYLLRNGYLNDIRETAMPANVALDPGKLLHKIPWKIQLNRPRWMIAGALSAILLVTSAAAYRWSRPSGQPESVGRSAPASGVLKLKVSRNGKDFEISWDRLSAAVQQATSGMLTINDGALTRAVALDGPQLREGQILYTPLFEELKFRLEVGTADQALAAESVQVLAWSGKQPTDVLTVPPPSSGTNSLARIFSNAAKSPAPAAETKPPAPLPVISKNLSGPAAPTPAPAAAAVSATKSAPAPAVTPATDTRPPAVNPVTAPQTVAVIPPAAPSPAAPKQEAPPAAILRVPEVSGTSAAPERPVVSRPSPAPAITPPTEPPASAAPKPPASAPKNEPKTEPPAVRQSPAQAPSSSPASPPVASPAAPTLPAPAAPTPAAVKPPVSTSAPILPVPITRVAPNAPRNLPNGSARLVSVRVMVDSAGSVQSAEVVSSTPKGAFGESLVKTAAVDAAKQWKFRPGQVNGKNIAAEYTIDFKFQ